MVTSIRNAIELWLCHSLVRSVPFAAIQALCFWKGYEVQVCDATKLNSSTKAWYIKNKKGCLITKATFFCATTFYFITVTLKKVAGISVVLLSPLWF